MTAWRCDTPLSPGTRHSWQRGSRPYRSASAIRHTGKEAQSQWSRSRLGTNGWHIKASITFSPLLLRLVGLGRLGRSAARAVAHLEQNIVLAHHAQTPESLASRGAEHRACNVVFVEASEFESIAAAPRANNHLAETTIPHISNSTPVLLIKFGLFETRHIVSTARRNDGARTYPEDGIQQMAMPSSRQVPPPKCKMTTFSMFGGGEMSAAKSVVVVGDKRTFWKDLPGISC